MLILMAIMVVCIAGGAFEAWNGHMGRCAVFLGIAAVVGAYVVLHAFVPGAKL
jgi:hypothetical protein